ncbi:MAG: dimethylsulfonioproprionate lyase family protein [Salaquimonas sp.]
MSVKPLLDAFRDYLSLRDEPIVHEWLDRFDWKLSERNLLPNPLYAMRHVKETEAHTGKTEARLVRSFIEYADRLHWMQSYKPEDFGQYFTDNYAHVELIGTKGHFASNEIAAGIVQYGPDIDYPNHWHVAEEIYIPLTGNGLWSSDNEPYLARKAGEFVFHESNMPHAIKTDDTPMLALWVWRGGDLAQKGNY